MTKRKHKECIGCGDNFLTFKNYDYCADCSINGNRYLTKSNCSECDGSGIIKFRNQKPRPCKLCHLTKSNMNNQTQKYWDQVNLLTQEKIHHLFTNNIPFQNIKLITEPWKFEERQQKLSGLFLRRDADYRTLLSDVENRCSEEYLLDKEIVADEIALWYCRMVIKSLITDLSDYATYDPSFFSNLTS